MKVAVCYSGMFRNFNETVDNHIQHLYSKYDCDVYFSFWDVYGDGGFNSKYTSNKRKTWDFEKSEFYETKVHDDKILQLDIDNIIKKINPVRYEFEEFSKFEHLFESKDELMNQIYGEKIDWLPHLTNIMSMYYKIYRCNNLISSGNYDCVLRMRSDLMFHEFGLDLFKPKSNTININEWGSSQQSYQDMIIYGDQIGMNKLSKLYFNLERVWNEIGRGNSNEHVLYHYLNTIDVNINMDTSIDFYKSNRGDILRMAGHYMPKKKINI